MNFWERVTGNDMTKALKTFELRAKKLPADYQTAWGEINANLWIHSISQVATSCQFLTVCLACSKNRQRTVRVSRRFWVKISKASVQRWPAKKGQSLSETSGASNSTII